MDAFNQVLNVADAGVPSVVHQTRDYIVVYKPGGMHSAPASPASAPEGTLCAWIAERFPSTRTIAGIRPGEGGLLHRLDRATRGLVLFALRQDAFDALQKAALAGRFVKRYRAEAGISDVGLQGSRPLLNAPQAIAPDAWKSLLVTQRLSDVAGRLSGAVVSSRFRPFGPGAARVACGTLMEDEGQPARDSKSKAWTKDVYTTEFVAVKALQGTLQLDVALSRGFRHQVRAHCAWLGLPLIGDAVYGEGGPEDSLALCATGISFPEPGNGRLVSYILES